MAGKVMEFTDANWKSEVLDAPVPVVVDFWAPWCGPCRMLAPTIEKLANEFEGKVKIGKMNTAENQNTPGGLRISEPLPSTIRHGAVSHSASGRPTRSWTGPPARTFLFVATT